MAKKIALVVVALLLVIGVTVGTTLLMDKTAVPASTTIENGLSAYELAVQYGYEGTVQEWLESLNGKSAYEIAVENGYSGTQDEWSTAINAAATQSAVGITTAKFSAKGELIIVLSDGTELNVGKAVGADGKDGANGKDGADGKNGTDGKDGVSISGASVNDNGQLVITYSDGKSVNLDKVVGMNGVDGIGISKSEINTNGELVLTYTNGQQTNLGCVIGADGKDGTDGAIGAPGQNGADGKDGVSITNSVINTSGELVITYSDGTTANLGKVVGADGKDGINGTNGTDGKDGINGVDGKDGVSVSSAEINSEGELVLTFSNGQRSNLGNVIGATGSAGKDGVDGTDGKDGADGADGKDGISITKSEINNKGELILTYSNGAVENLGVVVGADGKDGEDGKDGINGTNGTDGKDGANGKDGVGIQDISIGADGKLQIVLTNGTTMDLGNIKGADGKDGDDGKDGINGTNGTDGKDGANGANGKDGIGISGTTINALGELIITYSDGNETNLGKVAGIDGKDGINGVDGVGISKTEINAEGKLVVTYTNGNTETLGKIVGSDGKDGANGADGAPGKDGVDGKDGVGITSTAINAAGELIIVYSDGNSVNLGKIAGVDGSNGKDGVDGTNGTDGISITKTEINAEGKLVVTYSNGSSDTLGVVVGADGKDGTNGTNGTDGEDGVGISKMEINTSGELCITYSDGSTVNLGKVAGIDGKDGADGKDGVNGTDGKDGVNGVDGKDGIGVTKTEINANGELVISYSNGTSENLGKVVGADGKDGVNGTNGKDGINGTNGVDGKDGVDGEDGVGIIKAEIVNGELILYFSNNTSINLGNIKGADGKDGVNGTNGKDGTNGVDGKDGVGIETVTISDAGELSVKLTNGTVLNLGNIKGKDGIGISKSEINNKGELVLTYTSGEEVNVGKVVGSDGKDGANGTNGKDGVGIANVTVNADGELTVTLTDTTILDLGNIRGPQGEKGETGATGPQGPAGADGKDGTNGKDGADGKDGANGVNGVGVANAYVNSELHLILVLTDGTEIDAGYVGVSTDDNTDPDPKPEVPTTYTVTFKDWDGRVISTQTVESGKAATAPADPTRNDYTFAGWDKAYNSITSDLIVTATYTQNSSQKYTVTFVDYNGTTLASKSVNSGTTAELPANPSKSGATFLGWSGNYVNVTKNETVTAVYSDTKNVFVVESTSGSIGDTITVLVAVDGSVKTCGFDFNLFYDSYLELVSYDDDLDVSIIVNDSLYTNGIKLNFSDAKDKTKQRDIIELTFRIKDTTKSALPIWIDMKEVFEVMNSGAIENASYSIINGVVKVQ